MYHFIINPSASSGNGIKIWRKLKPILRDNGVCYRAHAFRREEELVAFVRGLTTSDRSRKNVSQTPLSESEDMQQTAREHIVVLGGDGTMNLVLNSIVDFDTLTLSCIRVGSGNDFARNVGIDKNARRALQHLIRSPEELMLDYGEAEYITADGQKKRRRFLISSGVGYDADICEEANRSRLKRFLNLLHLGKLVYVAIGVKQIFTRHNTRVKLHLEDSTVPVRKDNLFFVVSMIHPMEGGGVPFCPHANPTDGRLDLCLADGASPAKLLLEVVMVYLKKHLLFSNISEHRCRRLRVVTEKPQWIHMDGETPCRIREVSLLCRLGLHFAK